MDKIFSKIGLYDIIGVWLSGVIIMLITATITQEVYKWDVLKYSYLENPIIWIAGGYFVGMIFHEIGNFIQRNIFNKDNRIIRKILTEDKNSVLSRGVSLTAVERRFFKENKEFKIDEIDNEYIYNYCKYYVTLKTDTNSIDRNQVTAAISRSIGLYFAIMTIVSAFVEIPIKCEAYSYIIKLIAVLVFALLSLLLFCRAYRFVRMRYVRYFRAFYFNNLK